MKKKLNPFEKKYKQDNLARKLGTEESVEMVRDSLWRWNGKELVHEPKTYFQGYKKGRYYSSNKLFVIGAILGFSLGILFFHVFLVMPILANLSAPHY